jgi:hypothetical protein
LLVETRHEHINRIDNLTNDVAAQFSQWAADGHRAFRFTIAIGKFVFQVFGHNFPIALEVKVQDLGVLQCIWPLEGRVTWPPPNGVERIGGLQGLHDTFSNR